MFTCVFILLGYLNNLSSRFPLQTSASPSTIGGVRMSIWKTESDLEFLSNVDSNTFQTYIFMIFSTFLEKTPLPSVVFTKKYLKNIHLKSAGPSIKDKFKFSEN